MAHSKECGDSDDTKVRFCDPCQFDKEQTIAVGYCKECRQYLCKLCRQVHGKLTTSRDHAVKDVENQSEILSCESGMTCFYEKCLLHKDQLVDCYCVQHKEVFCNVCLSTAHRRCQKSGAVKNIPDYVKTIDIDKELEDFKSDMKNLVADVNDTMHLVQTSMKAIELNQDLARSEMLKLKTSMMEQIEQNYIYLDKVLNKMVTEDLEKTMLYKKKCDAIIFDLDAVDTYLKGRIVNNKQQLFLAIKNAKLKLSSNQIDLEESLDINRYKFKANEKEKNLTAVESFGTFDMERGALKTTRHEKNFNVCPDNDHYSCCVTGLAVLSEGRIVLADKNNKSVKLIDVEGERVVSKVSLDSAPWDVTVVSDYQLAATLPDIGTVNILSVSENKTLHNLIDRKINVSRGCCGIEFAKEKMYITVRDPPKIVVYNMNGELVSSVKLKMSNPQYITTNSSMSKIFVSDWFTCVKELDINDFKEIGDFKEIDDFKERRYLYMGKLVGGIAVDKTGVLYCCNRDCIKIVGIAERLRCGREFKNLISTINGQPKCVAFDDETNRLFVGNDSNEVAVYYVV